MYCLRSLCCRSKIVVKTHKFFFFSEEMQDFLNALHNLCNSCGIRCTITKPEQLDDAVWVKNEKAIRSVREFTKQTRPEMCSFVRPLIFNSLGLDENEYENLHHYLTHLIQIIVFKKRVELEHSQALNHLPLCLKNIILSYNPVSYAQKTLQFFFSLIRIAYWTPTWLNEKRLIFAERKLLSDEIELSNESMVCEIDGVTYHWFPLCP